MGALAEGRGFLRAEPPQDRAQARRFGVARADVRSERGPLGTNDRAVFRTRFTVSEEAPSASGIELWFGKIDGDGAVFFNGQRIGRTGESRVPTVFDLKALLHPGENSVAVTLANWGVVGGLNQGVRLRLVDPPPSPQWRRRVFNGLAQILIQTTGASGPIRLTATSKTLTSSTIVLHASPTVRRPSLP